MLYTKHMKHVSRHVLKYYSPGDIHLKALRFEDTGMDSNSRVGISASGKEAEDFCYELLPSCDRRKVGCDAK